MHRTSYSCPFEFLLPDFLPPSLASTSPKGPYVQYYVRLVLDKPWPMPDAVPIYPLTICPRVNLLQKGNIQEPRIVARHNRKKVQLQVCLVRNGILPGQYISIGVDLNNLKQSLIKRIEATFIQHRQIANIHDHQIIFRNDLPGIFDCREPSLQQNFDLKVPSTYLAPTYTFIPPNGGTTQSVIVHYELLLTVKTNGIFTDFDVSLPVAIGTDSALVEQYQPSWSNQFVQPVAGVSALNDIDALPSYAMAVMNKN